MFLIIFFIFASLPRVVADGWDDFSNNLATDLAPFLSLFGEQVTKQYLSESVTKLDYIIFAIAPIGILTAVVSAIRVCGSSSLRAFIGRAQEGGGNAEAELCSSTSRDVCELFQSGGITRVFGRPKILEIIFDPHDLDFQNGKAGIYTFLDHVKRQQGRTEHARRATKDSKDSEEDKGWFEHIQVSDQSYTDEESVAPGKSSPAPFAPNLSLNIGIQKQPPWVFWTVAFTGFTLQGGVLAFAGVITYYWQWERDGHQPDVYAFPLTLVGTLLVSVGTYCCAALIGDSTAERTFYNNDKDRNSGLSIYWIQPGGQIIGDQTFDAFAYSEADSKDPLREYIISQKNPIADDRRSKPEVATWAAVVVTISGFVLQFTGLRGIHAVVPVAQLGVTLVMSMARAALRMRRFKPERNCLSNRPDQIIGHELDWLALHIGGKDFERDADVLRTDRGHGRLFLRFCGIAEPGNRMSIDRPGYLSEPYDINAAGKLLAYRARLASLTRSQAGQAELAPRARNFRHEMVAVRQEAQRLARAIENTHTIFLSSKDILIQKEWQNDPIYWAVSVSLSYKFSPRGSDEARSSDKPVDPREQTLYLKLGGKDHKSWILDLEDRLEALLGLWFWSLKSDPLVEMKDQHGFIIPEVADIRSRRIIAANEDLLWELKMQHYEYAGSFTENELDASPDHHDPSIVWKYDPVEPDAANRPARYSCLEFFEKSDFQLVRFFGWDVARSSKMQNTAVKNSNLSVWSAASNTTLLSLCAQEVFTSFFWSMLDLVNSFDSAGLKQEAGKLYSQDSLLSQTVAAFVDSGIGDKRDALVCMLPPMVSHLGPSSIGDVVQRSKNSAIEYRKRQLWGEAQEVLRRVWDICKTSQYSGNDYRLADIAIALGELYRVAIMEKSREQFGFSGMKWLERQKFELQSTEPLPEMENAINRYVYIADRVAGRDRQGASGDSFGAADKRTTLLLRLTQRTIVPDVENDKLFDAAKNNWMEIVLALLELGATPIRADASQRTVLSYAAEHGSLEAVSELIAKGQQNQLNAADKQGRTPLSWAVGRGHHDLVEKLLDDPRVQTEIGDGHGHTPVFWAAKNGHRRVMELLIRTASVDTYSKDNDGRTLLHLAAEHGQLDIVKLLLDIDEVDLEAQDGTGKQPLFSAAKAGHREIVELLLDTGKANIDSPDHNKRTAIHWAAEYGQLEIVKLLLEKNANPNTENEWREGPEVWAIKNGHEEIAELLIQTGKLNLARRCVYGYSALRVARESGSSRIADMISQRLHQPEIET